MAIDNCVVCGKAWTRNHKCQESVINHREAIFKRESEVESRRWSDYQRLDYGFEILDLHRDGLLSDDEEEE